MTTKPPASPMSEADKEAFQERVLVWQGKLGLDDWRIQRSKKKTKNMSEVTIFHRNRLASYRIGDDFGADGVSPETIDSCALHEVLHVFLSELVHSAEYGIEGDALNSAEHRVIHMLEKLLRVAR